jgi:hypothetical protein
MHFLNRAQSPPASILFHYLNSQMAQFKTAENRSNNRKGILNIAFGLLFALLLYPLKVRKRYLRYNAVLREGELEKGATQGRFEAYRKNNIKLLNVFIHSTVAVSVVVLLGVIYSDLDGMARLASRIADVPRIALSRPKASMVNIKKYSSDIQVTAKKMNLRNVGLTFLGCYLFSFMGGVILSLNPAWKEERIIKNALMSNRYFDLNGEPWKAYWTPDAIIFHTYGCDPDAFVGNTKFWNTINFKPDIPVCYSNDATKVIVARAYALPALISFSMENT